MHYKHTIYTVPTFSNPSGRATRVDRCQQLVRLARKYDALIIADYIYYFIQWNSTYTNLPTPLIPRVVDINHVLDGGLTRPFGNAIRHASFSKILALGLRIGWTSDLYPWTIAVRIFSQWGRAQPVRRISENPDSQKWHSLRSYRKDAHPFLQATISNYALCVTKILASSRGVLERRKDQYKVATLSTSSSHLVS